jgi:exodeoxyribonuclease VII large subunit
MALDGVGDLYAAFEQLKQKLAAQGLFDPARKKPIPVYPKVIGIITSEAGAAVHDMLRILRKRYPLVKVRLLPVRVQGAEAPGEIAAAIRYADHYRLADLLIVGRGGGSIEDLWAFNDELVARAIYDCQIPVISAVGHEPDVTISDFVADLRAATPSNGAELAVPDRDALMQTLDSMSSAMGASVQRQIHAARRHLKVLSGSPVMQSPARYIDLRRQRLSLLSSRLSAAHQRKLSQSRQRYVALAAKLDAMSPLKVLGRGYAMVRQEDGGLVQSVRQVEPGDALNITLCDGVLRAEITEKKERF